MTIEIDLLQALSTKSNLDEYRHLINDSTLSSQSKELLKDFELYFEIYKTEQIEFSTFQTFFFQTRHPYLDENSNLEYKEILRLLAQERNVQSIENIICSFEQQELYSQLKRDIDKNVDTSIILEKIDSFKQKVNRINIQDEHDPEMDLDKALHVTDRAQGLSWRNQSLRDHFQGGIIAGDFIILGAETNAGKTSFLASEITHMAQQLEEEDYILWLNSEGNYNRIVPRLYHAALNTTPSMLRDNSEAAKKQYTKLMKGDSNKIRVIDIRGKGIKDVERRVKKRPPKLLIFDMLDHLKGFENYMGKEGAYIRYEYLYQWALELSGQYCPIIATSQVNREGYNKMYPEINNLRGSAVDKQSAATAIIMIGRLNGEDNIRYLSTPKFKIETKDSNQGDNWRSQVLIDRDRSRFI